MLAEKKKKNPPELSFIAIGKKAQDFCLENKINAHFMGFVGNTEGYLQNCDFVFVSRYAYRLTRVQPLKLSYLKSIFAGIISFVMIYYAVRLIGDIFRLVRFMLIGAFSAEAKLYESPRLAEPRRFILIILFCAKFNHIFM